MRTVTRDAESTGKPQSAVRSVVGLDFMRLAAASLVVLYHFFFWQLVADPAYSDLATPQQRAFFTPFAHFGWVGVEIFFLISGYVIAYSAQGANPYSFAKSRFLRIVPAVWIAAPITFALYFCFMGKPVSDLLPQFLRTVAFFPLFPAIDGVYWTLGIEVSFYLLVWSLICFKKISWLRHLPSVFCAVGLGFWLFYFTGMALITSPDIRVLFYKAIAFRPFQLLLIQHGAFFGMGIALKTLDLRSLKATDVAVLCGLVLTCWLEIIAQNGIIERSAHVSLSAWPALCVFTVALVLCTVLIAANKTICTHLPFLTTIARKIGLTTYPLYLLHNPIGLTVALICQPLIGLVPALSLGIVSAFICAYIVSRTLEPNVRATLAAILQKIQYRWNKQHTARPH